MVEAGAHELSYMTANRFYVEMDSTITASFSECSNLRVQIRPGVQQEGSINDQQSVLSEQAEFLDITLKRGVTDSLTFWQWIEDILAGKPNQRRNINILLLSQAEDTLQCWTLIGAVPVIWKAPALQADSNIVAIEELTLAHEGLQVKIRAKACGGQLLK
jgi:phage tail-like protein